MQRQGTRIEMKLINLTTEATAQTVIEALKDYEAVNDGVRFDENVGIPRMKVKEKGNSVRITCELTGRPTKDDGFLVGTYFKGKILQGDGKTTVKGAILTAPIYHLVLAAMFIAFIFVCISKGGFSIVPVCLLVFDYFMFRLEYKKQGIIQRYIARALKFAENSRK